MPLFSEFCTRAEAAGQTVEIMAVKDIPYSARLDWLATADPEELVVSTVESDHEPDGSYTTRRRYVALLSDDDVLTP